MACGGSSTTVDSMKPSATKADTAAGSAAPAPAEATASSSKSGTPEAASPSEASHSAADEDYGNAFASGDWRGYFWTSAQGAGSTISPKDFSAQASGMPRCVHGTVGATADNSGLAIFGANLKEDATGKMAVVPTKKGITVFVMSNTDAHLLFQVEGPDGKWCTYLNDGGGFLPWEKLNTACWNDSGQAYNKEPITTAAVIVPGNSTAPVTFDFCLLRLEEADGW